VPQLKLELRQAKSVRWPAPMWAGFTFPLVGAAEDTRFELVWAQTQPAFQVREPPFQVVPPRPMSQVRGRPIVTQTAANGGN